MRKVVAPGVAAVLALSGCGSGRLSHDQFVAHADAICSAYDAKVQLLAKPRSYEDVVAYVGRTLPLYVAAFDKLKALKPSRADEGAVRSWLAGDAKVVAAVRDLRAAALRHDPAATNDASTALQAASLASRHAAAALGMTVCASP